MDAKKPSHHIWSRNKIHDPAGPHSNQAARSILNSQTMTFELAHKNLGNIHRWQQKYQMRRQENRDGKNDRSTCSLQLDIDTALIQKDSVWNVLSAVILLLSWVFILNMKIGYNINLDYLISYDCVELRVPTIY